ncbi:DUF3011 domain-containing protein [Stenotrophomonas sp. SY1]|uniref:DUF3011 domain-containing protein n=1 Tax=Stenotrophomonas sp. SY1 TaxID=477235 RepID=UPI001E53B17E|nr:DUF3011 domain-containing protein [Stenotrophomonas sp. SY1]MCD9086192.1 DUF3011 domain-containing protein [Stenotrophomonas sp. SY1]
MNLPLLLSGLLTALPLALSALPAAAQSTDGFGSGTIRCESNDNRQRVCNTGWRSATLVRQLSKTQCVQGRNWGNGNGSVWVSGGCRAEFAEGRGGWGGGNSGGGWGGNGGTIRCESNDSRQRVCNTGWRSATLVRQLSNTQCVQGRNWGSGNGSVWVSGGCRAEFTEGRGSGGGWGGGNGGNFGTIRCESNDSRQRVCNTGWRRATLVRQLSNTQCIEGRNWGSGNGRVWVSGGCRAEFAEGRGSGGGWGGGNSGGWGSGSNYMVECASDGNRMRSCAWDRRQGRPVVIQQLSNTQCIEGRTWGYNGNSLWVNGGCRARFGTR